jgi:hypothetical protein
MIICNISLIKQVKDSRRRTQRSRLNSQSTGNRRGSTREGGRLTKTLILITIFFIVFTAPAAIYYISLDKIIKKHRNIITMSLSNLATTSHVTSFIIYWLISSDFRDAAISILCCRFGTARRLPSTKTDDKQQEKPVSNQLCKDENERKLPLVQSSTTMD